MRPPSDLIPRRGFLADSGRALAGGWLAAGLPWLATLAACGREDARTGAPLGVLTPAEGRALRALADRILPAGDGFPGAGEVGAAHVADRLLAADSLFATMLPGVRAGLADLDRRAARAGGGGDFASLAPSAQDTLVRAIETTEFFELARTLVLAGTFADPSYGGNRDGAGWRVIGLEHAAAYAPPFGHYDAEAARAAGGEAP